MRFTLTLSAALLCGTAARADDITLRADLARATVFASGAMIERQTTVDLPAGTHRLLIAMPDQNMADAIQVWAPEGVTAGAPRAGAAMPVTEGEFDTPAQAAARAALQDARDAVQAAQDALAEADATLRAIETQAAYLAALTSGGSAEMPDDPALVPSFLATLGDEARRLTAERQAAQVARRALVEAVNEAQDTATRAADALARLRPFGDTVDMIEVDVTVAEDVAGDLVISYLSPEADWRPSYEIGLNSETGSLRIERFVTLATYGPARWDGVEVIFSTAEPDRPRLPSGLSPSPVRIFEPAPPMPLRGMAEDSMGMPAEAPAPGAIAIEPVVIAAEMQVDGLSLSYAYGTPVTVGADGEVTLPLDSVTLEMETEARAVPRYDSTAYLVAMGDNDSGQPLLPGEARFYRDGALVGEDWLPLVADGAEMEMAFGPLDHLQLVWIDRTLAEGDRGIFTSSNTQVRELAFGVENTSDTPETVRVVYATPFSEQEDLELDLALDPSPDALDVDDRRGVHAWDLDVGPGARRLIEMRVELQWPEGMVLGWRP